MNDKNNLPYLGVFCISASLLFLEIFMTRILTFMTHSSYIYHSIAVAMLSFGTAGSIISLQKERLTLEKLINKSIILSFCGAISVIVLLIGVTLWKDHTNTMTSHWLNSISNIEFYNNYRNLGFVTTILCGILMGIPFFLFAMIIIQFFKTVETKYIPKLYAFDLLGAASGVLSALLLLEKGSYMLPATFAVFLPMLSAVVFSFYLSFQKGLKILVFSLAILILLNLPSIQPFMEPDPNLMFVGNRGKQKQQNNNVEEIWHTWTSFGRVSAISWQNSPNSEKEYAILQGSGEGWVSIIDPVNRINDVQFEIAQLALASVQFETKQLLVLNSYEKRILVLFAGAGSDMVAFDKLTNGKYEITGVELIPQITQWPQEQSIFELKNLKTFFKKPNIHLVSAEVREFLARNNNKYDMIFVSRSGHTLPYQAGLSTNAASYVFTREGIREILNHLAPSGALVVWQVEHINKIRLINTIESIKGEDDKAQLDAPKEYFIFSQSQNGDYWKSLHLSTLIFRPSGFTTNQLNSMNAMIDENLWTTLYDPVSKNKSINMFYQTIMGNKNSGFHNATAIDFSPSSDDRPFTRNVIPRKNLLSKNFWKQSIISKTENNYVQQQQSVLQTNIFLTIFFAIAATVIILFPLFLSKKSDRLPSNKVKHLIYFALLGAGFMFFQIALIQKMRLLVGHPIYTFGVVLISMILFAGLGNLKSIPSNINKSFNFRRIALQTAIYSILVLIITNLCNRYLLWLPHYLKILLAFFLPAKPSFLLGQLFPQGLMRASSASKNLLPWLIGINTASSTVATGLAISLSFMLGFNGVYLLGVACYCFIALLPNEF